ncbi:MAG: enoyl-CoA hydratase/isomerase family protein, partial [Myxococcales bacterium]|nr:enoyl-CoA hydratase/isomerase family protein [Myxococcales bacterium]
MARTYQSLVVTPAETSVTLALHNPARKNAIGPRMVNELLYALEDAHADAAVRSIVLTGSGDAFCAGGDFAQMTGGGDDLPHKGDYADLLLAITRAEKPVVARVNGAAMGGGLGLVAASHFAVAADSAKLGTPEINVGLFPMMIMAVLARVVPKRRLLEMMLFGEKMTAADALVAGLVGKVVPAAELDTAVAAITAAVASKSPSTIKLGLRAFADQADLSLEAALPML